MINLVRVRLRHARTRQDVGITLVEVIVACAILVIMSTAVCAVLLTALRTTDNDKIRVAASDLAARQTDIERQHFAGSAIDPNTGMSYGAEAVIANAQPVDPDPLSGGAVGHALVVDGVPFTVTVSVSVQTLAGASPCDGGAAPHPSYLVKATVTWPSMGLTQPVVNETVLTPPKPVVNGSVLNNPYGYLAVKVTNAAGHPAAHVSAQIVGPSPSTTSVTTPVTDSSGCAVVTLTQAGSYTATMNTPGYVALNGAASATNIPVTLGQVTVQPFSYDEAAQINATFSTDAADGFRVPATLPGITLFNSGLTPSGTTWHNTSTITGLWPFTSGYSLWAGSCADADPVQSGGSHATAVLVTPGGTATATVALAPVDILVVDSAGQPPDPGTLVTVQATDQTGYGCQGDESNLTLGTSRDGTGEFKTSLPFGTWSVSVTAGNEAGSSAVPFSVAANDASPVTETVIVS